MAEERTQQQVKQSTAETEATMRSQQVPVNVYETTAALVVLAPLPAVQPEDVHVELGDGQLRFWASLRSAGQREYLVHEWEYGGYERVVDVPAGYGSAVEATLTNGQLAVRVLKGDTTGKIEIQPQ